VVRLQIPCLKPEPEEDVDDSEDATTTGHSRKKYRCSLCSSSFSVPAKLKVHMRVHTGEKPYICLVCSKAFAHSTALAVHSRVHTGERPYSCSVCSESFISSSRLVAKTHENPCAGEVISVFGMPSDFSNNWRIV